MIFCRALRDFPSLALSDPSIRLSSGRPSVSRSVLFYFFLFSFCGFWRHCSCPNDLVNSNRAPGHPHVTEAVLYLAMFPWLAQMKYSFFIFTFSHFFSEVKSEAKTSTRDEKGGKKVKVIIPSIFRKSFIFNFVISHVRFYFSGFLFLVFVFVFVFLAVVALAHQLGCLVKRFVRAHTKCTWNVVVNVY